MLLLFCIRNVPQPLGDGISIKAQGTFVFVCARGRVKTVENIHDFKGIVEKITRNASKNRKNVLRDFIIITDFFLTSIRSLIILFHRILKFSDSFFGLKN